jgi:hypothetical protein
LSDRQAKWLAADGSLQVCLQALPTRDRIALRCLIVRDMYHLLELYVTYARSVTPAAAPAASTCQRIEEKVTDEERPIPFSEWLFMPPTDLTTSRNDP